MMTSLRGYNLQPETVSRQIGALVQGHGALYDAIRIRAVAVRHSESGKWHNALTIINVWPHGEPQRRRDGVCYPDVRLLEEWRDVTSLPKLIEQIQSTKLLQIGSDVVFDQHAQFTQSYFVPGGNNYSALSGWCYEAGRGQTPNVTYEPLLAPGLPIYLNGFHAIEEWLDMPGLAQNDARIGEALLFLPECRAGLKIIEVRDEKLIVHPRVASEQARSGLELKGAWMIGTKRATFQFPFSQEVVLDVPEGATGFAVYVVGADGTLYDFHDETGRWVQGGQRILGSFAAGAPADVVQKALRSCEGETVEFKPFVEMDNLKQNEIVESVIAFANTLGGVILFGVDKHAQVVGIEQELFKLARTSGKATDAVLADYKGKIGRLIGDQINRSLDLEFHDVKVEGHSLLVLIVPEGKERPYAKVRSNDIWVRKGSNNVRPDPDADLPDLVAPSGPTSDALVGYYDPSQRRRRRR